MDCPVLTLKQNCPTRWISTADMFERILKIKEPLQSPLAILAADCVPKLCNEDWYTIEKSCDIRHLKK